MLQLRSDDNASTMLLCRHTCRGLYVATTAHVTS